MKSTQLLVSKYGSTDAYTHTNINPGKKIANHFLQKDEKMCRY